MDSKILKKLREQKEWVIHSIYIYILYYLYFLVNLLWTLTKNAVSRRKVKLKSLQDFYNFARSNINSDLYIKLIETRTLTVTEYIKIFDQLSLRALILIRGNWHATALEQGFVSVIVIKPHAAYFTNLPGGSNFECRPNFFLLGTFRSLPSKKAVNDLPTGEDQLDISDIESPEEFFDDNEGRSGTDPIDVFMETESDPPMDQEMPQVNPEDAQAAPPDLPDDPEVDTTGPQLGLLSLMGAHQSIFHGQNFSFNVNQNMSSVQFLPRHDNLG